MALNRIKIAVVAVCGMSSVYNGANSGITTHQSLMKIYKEVPKKFPTTTDTQRKHVMKVTKAVGIGLVVGAVYPFFFPFVASTVWVLHKLDENQKTNK